LGHRVLGLKVGVAGTLALVLAACGSEPPPQNSYIQGARPIVTADVQPRRANAPEMPNIADQPLAKSTPKETAATLTRLGKRAADEGNVEGGIQLYRRALALDPGHPSTTLALSDLLYRSGDYRSALETYRQTLRLDPVNDEAMRGMGKTLIALDRRREADDQYRAVLKCVPRDHRSLNGLGVALDMVGDHDDAQIQYRLASTLAPNDPGVQNNMALSLALTRNYPTSLDILTRLVNTPQSTARNRQNLALVYGLMGDEQRAAEIGRQDLTDEQVQRNLAYYAQLRQLNDQQRSAAVFNTDTRRLPDLPDRRMSAVPGTEPADLANTATAAGAPAAASPQVAPLDAPPAANATGALPGGWTPVEPPPPVATEGTVPPQAADAPQVPRDKPAALTPAPQKPSVEQTSALPARRAGAADAEPAAKRSFLDAVLAAPRETEAMARNPVMTTPAATAKGAAPVDPDPAMPPFSDLAK